MNFTYKKINNKQINEEIRQTQLSIHFTVLHTVQINFHAVDVNKYIYIQTPIGLLILEFIGHVYTVQYTLDPRHSMFKYKPPVAMYKSKGLFSKLFW